MPQRTSPDQLRAEALKRYLLNLIIQGVDLSADTISQILLGYEKGNATGKNHANRLEQYIGSVGQLAEALANLQAAIEEKKEIHTSEKGKKGFPLERPPLTAEEIGRAFQILGQLSPDELSRMGLPPRDAHPLIDQALLNLALYHDEHSQHKIRDFYRASIGATALESPDTPFKNLNAVEEYIDNFFSGQLSDHLNQYLEFLSPDEKASLQMKVKNAINRLLSQAGTGQIRYIKADAQSSYIQNYITPGFIKRFTQSVIENNVLNSDFPIFLRSISLNLVGPLPLTMEAPTKEDGIDIVYKNILELHNAKNGSNPHLYAPIDEHIEQLLARRVPQVVAEFHVRLEKVNETTSSYIPFSRDVFEELAVKSGGYLQIYFKVESTGLGGTFSQVARVLNAAVFRDINCLKREFFPITHDVLVNSEIIQNNTPSPVWSHSFVRLCRHKTMEDSLNESCRVIPHSEDESVTPQDLCTYESLAFIDPVGRGDYCSFDALVGNAKAALQARLRAIGDTGIDAKSYKHDLLRRIEQQHILDTAKSLISGYPFSSFAMESHLDGELFKALQNKSELNNFSYIIFDAYLTIAENFLIEGAYRNAFVYIKPLRDYLGSLSDNGVQWCQTFRDRSGDGHEILSGEKFASSALLVRYEICVAEYLYVVDWQAESAICEETRGKYFLDLSPISSVSDIMGHAWTALDRAEQLLTVRLAKYHVIGEVSQATFSPYYRLLSRIYLLRAKIFTFFPRKAGIFSGVDYRPPTDFSLTPNSNSRTSADIIYGGRLFLFERARMYAACDGNDILYIIATAHQCWTTLMFCLSTDTFSIKAEGNRTVQVDADQCLRWARKLRDHALLKYTDIGQWCYHEVKQRSGLLEESTPFGRYSIDTIPIIREIVGESRSGERPGYEILRNSAIGETGIPILYLDMNLLSLPRGKVDADDRGSTQLIYLFGPKACHLFFIRGIYHLCSPYLEEFSDVEAEETGARLYPEDEIDWDRKLKECYRLFNYAWSIADDGCKIERVGPPEQSTGSHGAEWKIKRCSAKDYYDVKDADAESVWDLYPHRETEIADLAKIFAAACAVLRLYTDLNVEARTEEITWLLGRLKRETDFKSDPTLKQSLYDQERYNGHIEYYLDGCRERILRELRLWQEASPQAPIAEKRDTFISELFELMLNYP